MYFGLIFPGHIYLEGPGEDVNYPALSLFHLKLLELAFSARLTDQLPQKSHIFDVPLIEPYTSPLP